MKTKTAKRLKPLPEELKKLDTPQQKIDFLRSLINQVYETNPSNSRTLSAINTSLELMAKLQHQTGKQPLKEEKPTPELPDLDWRQFTFDLTEDQKVGVAKVFNRIDDYMKGLEKEDEEKTEKG